MKTDDWGELEETYRSDKLSAEHYHITLEEADHILLKLCFDISKTTT